MTSATAFQLLPRDQRVAFFKRQLTRAPVDMATCPRSFVRYALVTRNYTNTYIPIFIGVLQPKGWINVSDGHRSRDL
jgi:hypothetical protein